MFPPSQHFTVVEAAIMTNGRYFFWLSVSFFQSRHRTAVFCLKIFAWILRLPPPALIRLHSFMTFDNFWYIKSNLWAWFYILWNIWSNKALTFQIENLKALFGASGISSFLACHGETLIIGQIKSLVQPTCEKSQGIRFT